MFKKLDVLPGYKTIVFIVLAVAAEILAGQNIIPADVMVWLRPTLLGLIGVGASVKVDRLAKKK